MRTTLALTLTLLCLVAGPATASGYDSSAADSTVRPDLLALGSSSADQSADATTGSFFIDAESAESAPVGAQIPDIGFLGATDVVSLASITRIVPAVAGAVGFQGVVESLDVTATAERTGDAPNIDGSPVAHIASVFAGMSLTVFQKRCPACAREQLAQSAIAIGRCSTPTAPQPTLENPAPAELPFTCSASSGDIGVYATGSSDGVGTFEIELTVTIQTLAWGESSAHGAASGRVASIEVLPA